MAIHLAVILVRHMEMLQIADMPFHGGKTMANLQYQAWGPMYYDF